MWSRRLETFGALLVCLAGSLACGGNEPVLQDVGDGPTPPSMTPSDGSVPGVDGGVPKPGADAGASTPCPCTFVEEFVNPARFSASDTTATVDPAGAGTLRAAPGFVLEGAGAGGEGSLVLSADGTITPGSHEYTAINIDGADVRISGDAILRVSGPINLRGGASLVVTGKLTLVSSGDVTIDCSRIVTTGDLVVHQPSGGFTARCATAGARAQVLTDFRVTGNSGSIAVWTRGSIRLDGSVDLYSGSVQAASARSGAVDLRAYGDVAIGPGDGLVITGGTAGANGDLGIFSEGRLALAGLRVAGGDSTAASASGGTVRLHAKGPVAVSGGGNLLSSPGGSVEVFTESALSIENTSFILTPEGGNPSGEIGIHLRAKSLKIGSAAVPGDRSAVIGRSGTSRSASVRVEVLEDIELIEAATLGTTPVSCLPAGDVTLSAERNIVLGPRVLLKAGDSRSGTGCAAVRGGSLSVSAAGTIQNGGAVASGGTGAPNGMTDLGEGRPVKLGVLAAELVPLLRATSASLPLDGATATPAAIDVAWGQTSPSQYSGLHLAVGVGDALALVRHEPALGAGWRYRLYIEPRMFDAVTLDGFTLRY